MRGPAAVLVVIAAGLVSGCEEDKGKCLQWGYAPVYFTTLSGSTPVMQQIWVASCEKWEFPEGRKPAPERTTRHD